MDIIVQVLINVIIAIASSIVTFLLTNLLQLQERRKRLLLTVLKYLYDIELQTTLYERSTKEISQRLDDFYIEIQIYFNQKISDSFYEIILEANHAVRISQSIKLCTIKNKTEEFEKKVRSYIKKKYPPE